MSKNVSTKVLVGDSFFKLLYCPSIHVSGEMKANFWYLNICFKIYLLFTTCFW